MAKKRKSKDPIIVILIGSFIVALLEAIIGITLFIFTIIGFYRSGFKKKTGIGFFKTFTNKGTKGEYLLYKELIKIFKKENIFVNVYLDNTTTTLTEVDLLVIAKEGVYVLEMKNYSGYIYGTDTDKEWTQVLNKRTKNRFYNPLRQNYAHEKAVESYLSLNEGEIIPMIVFSDKSKLSKITSHVNKSPILNLKDAKKYLKTTHKNKEKVFTTEKVSELTLKLESRVLVEQNTKEAHIQEVIELKQDN